MGAIIYILYNANASALGKVQYAYRKMTAPADNSPCAACDLTHGGLRFSETKNWTETRNRIAAEVKQVHRDEASQEILDFVAAHNEAYPLVLAQGSPTDKFKVLLNAKELGTCGGDHERFLSLLADHAAKEGINLEVRGVKD